MVRNTASESALNDIKGKSTSYSKFGPQSNDTREISAMVQVSDENEISVNEHEERGNRLNPGNNDIRVLANSSNINHNKLPAGSENETTSVFDDLATGMKGIYYIDM